MNSVKILVNSLDNFYPNNSPNPSVDLDSIHEFDDDEVEALLPPLEVSEPETLNDNEQIADDEKYPISDDFQQETERPHLETKSWIRKLGEILFIPPNYIIIKPLTFVWLLITFPFTYFFQSNEYHEPFESESDKKEHESSDKKDRPQEVIHEKTELLKQENIMSNTIKSPSSSSKYIIPPPQRLFPLSRNPGKRRKRKTLILDLDETLIHSLSRASPRSFGGSSSHMIEIKLNNMATLYYVHKRPFCDYFLKEIAKWFELQIFTASVKEYADPIIDWLESDIINYINPPKKNKSPSSSTNLLHGPHANDQPRVFTRRYYRTDCTYRPGVGYIKDLSKFFPKEDDLKNVIILDNSPVSYALHEDNAVMIEGWINDQSDRDLLNLLPMLHSLSLCIDIRYILGLKNGEKALER